MNNGRYENQNVAALGATNPGARQRCCSRRTQVTVLDSAGENNLLKSTPCTLTVCVSFVDRCPDLEPSSRTRMSPACSGSTNDTHAVCPQIVQRGFQQIIFAGAVEHCDLCSLRREQQRCGAPAQPCSKHGHVLVFVASVVHRSFSVASPSKAKMIEESRSER